MKHKHARLWQNLAILGLSVSAMSLLGQVVSFELGLDGSLKALTSQFSDTIIAPSFSDTTHAVDLSTLSAPMNLVVTGEYGRYGSLLVSSSTAGVDQAQALLREALGSAYGGTEVSSDRFQELVAQRGVYFDFLIPVPVSVMSGRLQAEFDPGGSARYYLVTDAGGSTATLYLWDGSGSIRQYSTAVDLSALSQVITAFESNDARFAFEAGEEFSFLDPYTLVTNTRFQAPLLHAATPAAAQAIDDLLSLLDFNPHTNSRYPLSNGTEVVVEYPRTLRVQSDGTILYTGGTEPASSLYQVSSAGESTTQTEAVLAALQLSETLLSYGGIDVSSLWFSGITAIDDGWIVTLDYQVNGIPVYFSDGESAISVEISGTTITAFHCRFRQYSVQESTYPLLPLAQTIAMASSYEDGFLTVGYVDQSGEQLTPTWLVR